MITQEQIAQKILQYLNGQVDLPTLVQWSEETLFNLSESGDDVPGESSMMRILGYLGAGDSADFPLTWEVLSKFLEQLGTKVRVIADAV
jgi:hypothetical protein